GIADGDTTVTLLRDGRIGRWKMVGGPSFEHALELVARRLGVGALPPERAVDLYTIQFLASRSPSRTARFASELEGRRVHVETSFFHQACLPCSIPEVKVLGPEPDGLYRVVTGIFDRRA